MLQAGPSPWRDPQPLHALTRRGLGCPWLMNLTMLSVPSWRGMNCARWPCFASMLSTCGHDGSGFVLVIGLQLRGRPPQLPVRPAQHTLFGTVSVSPKWLTHTHTHLCRPSSCGQDCLTSQASFLLGPPDPSAPLLGEQYLAQLAGLSVSPLPPTPPRQPL